MFLRTGLCRTFFTGAVVLSLMTSAFAANPFLRSSFELPPGDLEIVKSAAQNLYLDESKEVGAVETWRSDTTGNYGSVELILIHAHNGLPCRRLQHDIRLSGVANPYRFIIDRCKVEDGSWKFL